MTIQSALRANGSRLLVWLAGYTLNHHCNTDDCSLHSADRFSLHNELQVCGSDGYTYDNICVLRTWSAGARLDYQGRCLSEFDRHAFVEEVCERVREEGRCEYDSSNCDTLVFPDEGCCPICGKSILLPISLLLRQ